MALNSKPLDKVRPSVPVAEAAPVRGKLRQARLTKQERVTFEMDSALHTEMKLEAIKRRMSVRDLIAEAVKDYLAKGEA